MHEQGRIQRRALLAAAGCALLPGAGRAAADAAPDVTFVVVSDTHLGYRDQETAARQWQRLAAELAGLPGEFVLHLGDIVDGGREAQYAPYLEARKAVGKPVHEIPGNHDPAPLFTRHVRRETDIAFEAGGVRFLLINNSRPDSHDGFVSREQLDWLERELAEAARRKTAAVLCAHVPVHHNVHPDRGWYVKPEHGQRELYALLDRHRGRVLALFHGHFHNGIRGWKDRAPLQEIVFPSALYNLDRRLEAQNAPGYNLPEFRPGCTLVTIRGNRITLRYKPLGADPGPEARW